jgi:hypothetical protein
MMACPDCGLPLRESGAVVACGCGMPDACDECRKRIEDATATKDSESFVTYYHSYNAPFVRVAARLICVGRHPEVYAAGHANIHAGATV